MKDFKENLNVLDIRQKYQYKQPKDVQITQTPAQTLSDK
jgi:hypothetical protein